jgi:DNA polymerase/3'-5' exonuclease PolX
VGKRLADKIWEIVQHGQLQKLDFLNEREDLSAINLFTKIHGVGPSTAQSFVAQGFRTLNDLRDKANLNKQQLIGLKYIDEFQIRIPREEVIIIENIVSKIF